jgi:hypothetical protein
VKSTISRPREILVTVIPSDPSWRVLRQQETGRLALAEKPKMGELQMDWLRSEDLKEEKNVTAPIDIIAVDAPNSTKSLPKSYHQQVAEIRHSIGDPYRAAAEAEVDFRGLNGIAEAEAMP